ncbi:MAG: hypothetical protein GY805_07190 [Chloroflexi bacterium]|nr:hypothetical protein [Chloroflexota bacterium]
MDDTLTDRGFTGHKGNRDIGLTYMNARFYVPNTNRMLTPDTIVPDPTNPQSFNRYSYVLNSPLNFRDPTGHNPVCNQDGSICSDGEADNDPLISPPSKSLMPVRIFVRTGVEIVILPSGYTPKEQNMERNETLATVLPESVMIFAKLLPPHM